MEPLILASASPQRKVLLEGIGIPFEVIPSQVDEDAHAEREPAKRAVILSQEKAQDIASRYKNRWVIGCDTLVMAPDGSLLEKATDEADARRMLKLQSGGISIVHSGLTVLTPTGIIHSGLSSSSVHFKPLSESDIDWWMSTNLWQNRSGSFQIDSLGQLMIKRIEGDWTSIVGLPVFLLGELLEKAGYPFRGVQGVQR